MWLHESDSGKTIANQLLLGGSYTGPIVISAATETLRDITFQRWHILNPPGAHAKWGKLTYNEEDCIHDRVFVEGIEKEHAIYSHSPRGDATFLGYRAYDIGAQGYQETGRRPESDDPDACLLGGTTTFARGSVVSQCGQPRGYGRASYAMSFFGWQEGDGSTPRAAWNRPVVLKGVRIEHDSMGMYELRGALLCEHRPSLTVEGGATTYLGTADRDLWHIFQTKEVYVSGHSFEGQRTVDIDGATKIVWVGNYGNVKLRVNGTTVGPVSQDFLLG